MKKYIRTIDLTPTWSEILPLLLAIYTDSNSAGRAVALDELKRMAQLADAYVASPKPLGPDENIGSVET